MNLVINGKIMSFEASKTIQEILRSLNIESKVVAVTLNSELVKKDDYTRTIPNDGDRIELLQFMGGG